MQEKLFIQAKVKKHKDEIYKYQNLLTCKKTFAIYKEFQKMEVFI